MNLFKQGKKIWSTRLAEFSRRTSLHGFNEMYNAENLTGKIFWILSLSICLSITIYQLSLTFYQYVNEPYVTVIDNLKEDEMMYENLSFCYPHWVYWVDFEKAFKLHFTKPSILYGLSYATTIYSETRFDVREAERNFLSIMALNNFTKISHFYSAIAKSSPHRDFDGFEHFLMELCYKANSQKVVQKYLLENQHAKVRHDITLDFELNQQNFYQLKFDQYSLEEYNCYMAKLLQSRHKGKIMMDQFFNGYYDQTNPVLLTSYLKVAKGFTEIRPNDSYLEVRLRATVSKRKNRKSHPCDTEDTARTSLCEIDCMFKYRLQHCLCHNIQWYTLQNGYDEIGTLCRHKILFFNKTVDSCRYAVEKMFSLIPPSNVSPLKCPVSESLEGVCCNDEVEENEAKVVRCIAECLPHCTKWEYEFGFAQKMEDAKYMKMEQFSTNVFITFPSSHGVLFTNEIANRSIERLFSNIGGLLGIWLGGSVISFLQLIFLCCCGECRCSSGLDYLRVAKKKDKRIETPFENNNV